MNHDYKYEGMSEEDRNSLIPAIKGTAKNPEPEKRDRFIADLIKAKDDTKEAWKHAYNVAVEQIEALKSQMAHDEKAWRQCWQERKELLAALRNLAQTIECEPKGSPNIGAAIGEAYAAIAKVEGGAK